MLSETISHIDLIGFPMDLGANRRGVDMGAAAMRIAGLQAKLESLGYTVVDQGDIPVPNPESRTVTNPRLKFVAEIVEAAEHLAGVVENSSVNGRLPLCLGGDHSMALGSLAGLAAASRRLHLTPGLIWIDAHTDMNIDSTSPTGNVHGMVLAASLGLGHPSLTGVGGFNPKLLPEHCALLGIRSIDPAEKANVLQNRLHVATMTDIDRHGIAPIISTALDNLENKVDWVHISFDLDAVEPGVAPGVGTPVPGGLTFREAHYIMEAVAERCRIASIDVAEINPVLDVRNQSAEFATEIVASCLGKRII